MQVFEEANKAYVEVGLTAHPGKRQRRESKAIVLGAEIDGMLGRISAPRTRVVLLSFITAIIVQKGHATKELLQGLIGCWTHILLFRRPAFAVLEHLYHEGSDLHPHEVFRLSKAARSELMSLCVLAPTFQTNMRTVATPHLYMMDASRMVLASVGRHSLQWELMSSGGGLNREGITPDCKKGLVLRCVNWVLNMKSSLGPPSQPSDKMHCPILN